MRKRSPALLAEQDVDTPFIVIQLTSRWQFKCWE
ncbi:putative lipopolysaccharide heptosyltransferase III|nr:putative lipopolysaccharide heptosyltransferase III [Candidatus Pantoea persica]